MAKIRDRRVGTSGYSEFASSSVVNEGRGVRFVFRNGSAFEVPAMVLRAWRSAEGRLNSVRAAPRVKRSRRVTRGEVIRLFWSDGIVQDVVWDTVLMGCEPRYEHFGGLTNDSRAFTKRVFDQFGPFAIG